MHKIYIRTLRDEADIMISLRKIFEDELHVNQWREKKETGVDAREGALKDSLLSVVFFQNRKLTPPESIAFQVCNVLLRGTHRDHVKCVSTSWLSSCRINPIFLKIAL